MHIFCMMLNNVYLLFCINLMSSISRKEIVKNKRVALNRGSLQNKYILFAWKDISFNFDPYIF